MCVLLQAFLVCISEISGASKINYLVYCDPIIIT